KKSYESQVHLSDFWSQYNEHRPFIPELTLFSIARLTRWNMGYEYAFNFVVALGIAAVIFHQITLTARALNIPSLKWAVPAASAILFSVADYENWLWSWQMTLLLSMLAALSALTILANGVSWLRLICSIALATVATYSFANGLLLWPIGIGILLFTRAKAS